MRTLTMVCSFVGLLAGFPASATTFGEPFPGYDAECGYPIVYFPNATVSQAVINRAGTEIIVLDPTLAEAEQDARRQFLIAHECAHHQMKHATSASRQQRMRSERVVRDQEMSADCWAAETLARKGLDRPLQVMADRFFKAGLYSPGGGYPAGVQRSTIILHCAETGRQARRADMARIEALASVVPRTF